MAREREKERERCYVYSLLHAQMLKCSAFLTEKQAKRLVEVVQDKRTFFSHDRNQGFIPLPRLCCFESL